MHSYSHNLAVASLVLLCLSFLIILAYKSGKNPHLGNLGKLLFFIAVVLLAIIHVEFTSPSGSHESYL